MYEKALKCTKIAKKSFPSRNSPGGSFFAPSPSATKFFYLFTCGSAGFLFKGEVCPVCSVRIIC